MKFRAEPLIALEITSPTRVVSRGHCTDIEHRIVQLFDQLHQPVHRYMRWIGVPAADADELVQDVFLRLVEHLREGRNDEHLRAWLYRVAHTLSINRLKGRRFTENIEPGRWIALAETRPDPVLGPEEQLLARERFRRLASGMAALSAQQRECVCLRAEGFRYREIAEILGVSVPTVGESLRRAIRKLMKNTDD